MAITVSVRWVRRGKPGRRYSILVCRTGVWWRTVVLIVRYRTASRRGCLRRRRGYGRSNRNRQCQTMQRFCGGWRTTGGRVMKRLRSWAYRYATCTG